MDDSFIFLGILLSLPLLIPITYLVSKFMCLYLSDDFDNKEKEKENE